MQSLVVLIWQSNRCEETMPQFSQDLVALALLLALSFRVLKMWRRGTTVISRARLFHRQASIFALFVLIVHNNAGPSRTHLTVVLGPYHCKLSCIVRGPTVVYCAEYEQSSAAGPTRTQLACALVENVPQHRRRLIKVAVCPSISRLAMRAI